MRIRRLRIRDFRSIVTFDVQVPPAGMNITGPNDIGKSNILRAIKADLLGKGVSPDAIRDGADDSEIVIDTDDPKLARIRQSITQEGGTLTVRDAENEKRSRPRERLTELFGPECFDPLAFYRAKPAEQRRMVLAASPVKVTADDLAKWMGGYKIPVDVDLNRNGLEVIETVRKACYALRRDANKAAEDAAVEVRRAQDEAERLAKDEHKGVLVPLPGEEDAPVRAAEKARDVLEQRREAAEEMAKRTEGTRKRIAELRSERDELLARPDAVRDKQLVACLRAEVEEAQEDFERARKHLEAKKTELANQESADKKARELLDRAEACHIQADGLEATLAETAIEPPTQQELADSDRRVSDARVRAELVRCARDEQNAWAKVTALAAEAKAAKDEADRLDRIVNALAVDAPSELAARGNLIPGLSIMDDGVLYQGRPTDDSMSGSTRLRVAVELTKRLSPKAGVLLVDEIGVLDAEHMREFVRLCTADGWQLISTCMRNTVDAAGKPTREMVIEAFEPDAEDLLDPNRRVKVKLAEKDIG